MNWKNFVVISICFLCLLCMAAHVSPFKIILNDSNVIVESNKFKYDVFKTKMNERKIFFLVEKKTGVTSYAIAPEKFVLAPNGDLVKRIAFLRIIRKDANIGKPITLDDENAIRILSKDIVVFHDCGNTVTVRF